jgi:hypothetical protein
MTQMLLLRNHASSLQGLVSWLDIAPAGKEAAAEGGGSGAVPALRGLHAHDAAHVALRCLYTWVTNPAALLALESSTHAVWFLKQLIQASCVDLESVAHSAVPPTQQRQQNPPEAQQGTHASSQQASSSAATGSGTTAAAATPHVVVMDMNAGPALHLLASISHSSQVLSALNSDPMQGALGSLLFSTASNNSGSPPITSTWMESVFLPEPSAGRAGPPSAITEAVQSDPGMQDPLSWLSSASAAICSDVTHLPALPQADLALLLQRLVLVAWPSPEAGQDQQGVGLWATAGYKASNSSSRADVSKASAATSLPCPPWPRLDLGQIHVAGVLVHHNVMPPCVM